MAISGKTRVLGVWGYPVGHSRSPAMHNAAIEAMGLDWVYVAFQVNPELVRSAVDSVRALDLVGINVTVPLKEMVGDYLDEIDPAARAIGSVNTIVNRAGRLVGYSSDGPGFLWDLERQGVDFVGKPVLVWGAGGSARAIAFALAGSGCRVAIANRTVERARQLAAAVGGETVAMSYDSSEYAAEVKSAALLVNATSLGMGVDPSPGELAALLKSDRSTLAGLAPPIPHGALHSGQVVYDLVYMPERTVLHRLVEPSECRTIGGIGMLVCQGAVSLSHWSGVPIHNLPIGVMLAAVDG